MSEVHTRLLERLIDDLIDRRPLPWHIEWDWTCEVLTARDQLVLKCMTEPEAHELISLAEKIISERAAAHVMIEAMFAD